MTDVTVASHSISYRKVVWVFRRRRGGVQEGVATENLAVTVVGTAVAPVPSDTDCLGAVVRPNLFYESQDIDLVCYNKMGMGISGESLLLLFISSLHDIAGS